MRYVRVTALLFAFTLFAHAQQNPADPGFKADDNNGQAGQVRVVRLFTQILPSYEIGPIFPSSGNPEAGAYGVARPKLVIRTDPQGTVTQVSARLRFTLCGLSGESITFRKVDIHSGLAGARGATVIDTAVSDSNPLTLPVEEGCVSDSLAGAAGPNTTLADTAAQIMKDPASFYFEVHTIPNNPTGLARGQLAPAVSD